MEETVLWGVCLVFGGLIIGYLLAKIYFLLQMKKLRQVSVKQSRSVVIGQVSEQMAPLIPDFPYHYKDAMFL